MQINLQSPLLKESLKYLAVFIIGILVASWFHGCSASEIEPQIAKVVVPEVKGKFEAKKPVHESILNKAKSPQLKNSTSKEILQVENPINKKLIAENEKLKKDFAKANDSIKQLSFNKAIQINKFSTKFEDENLVLNIDGIVQGEVKEITPNYKIKEKKIEVPVKVKETVFRLLAGVEVGNTTQLDAFKLRANIMFQNRKGNIISGSFDTNQTVWVGYNVSIFNIKR
jgi:hypothetical protein